MAKKNPDVAAYQRLLAPPPEGYGMTKTKIAGMLGVSKQAITRWEAVPLRYVVELSQKTGIPKSDLLPSVFT